jgi:copper oxidase (laccase) domain-containing protein
MTHVSVSDAGLRYSPFSGRVSIYLFGRPLDWSLAGDDAADVQNRLSVIARELGVKNILAPRPVEFNASVCTIGDLTETCFLGDAVDAPILYRGCNADGVELLSIPGAPLYAYWVGSADCITIVAHDAETGKTFAAHAGRDCILDRERIKGGPSRKYESVVHAIMDRFSAKEKKSVRVFMTCGIGPDHFDHLCDDPTWGQFNTRMVLDLISKWGRTALQGDPFRGKICLSEIIRSQFISLGVPAHRIGYDGVETVSDCNRDGDYVWWSYRRGDGKKRNGVLVVRNW